MDRILKILKKENGPSASSAPALELNTIIFKHVYWYMQQISGERLQDHWSSGFFFRLELKFRNTIGDIRNTIGDIRDTIGDIRNTIGDIRNTIGDIRNSFILVKYRQV